MFQEIGFFGCDGTNHGLVRMRPLAPWRAGGMDMLNIAVVHPPRIGKTVSGNVKLIGQDGYLKTAMLNLFQGCP